jgi:hypothetical protein
MKKITLVSMLFLVLVFSVNSQTISPSLTSEVCVGVNITFSVTISGTNVTSVTPKALNVNPTVISPPSNISINNGIVTFDFVGRFSDYNNKQTFTINYLNLSGIPSTWDATYIKVKSLLVANSCSHISPNQGSINALPCEIANHAISFSNVQYGNSFESPQICYGTVTSYEYLLPVGWVLNSTTSTGSNWIGGSNSVMVTSDLSHGGNISIRPANSCTSGLITGEIVTIPVIRQKPPLTFTGGFSVCTSQNFQANSVPAWVTNYTWLVTPNTVFGNSNPTSNPTTVTKIASGEGDIQLTISSSSCPLNFVYNTLEITGNPKLVAGLPSVQSTESLIVYGSPGDENDLCLDEEKIYDFTTGSGSTTTWSYVTHSGNPQPSWSPMGEDLSLLFFRSTQHTIVFHMDVANPCGSTTYDFGFNQVDCTSKTNAPNLFKISPNPANNFLNITPIELNKDLNEKLISEVIISDLNSVVHVRKIFQNIKSTQLSIGNLKLGTYFVRIISGDYFEVQTLIKR